MSVNFTFAGNGAYGNRGCEAIIRGSVKVLETVFPDCNFNNAYFPDNTPDKKNGQWDKRITYYPIERRNPRKDFTSIKWWHYKLLSYYSKDQADLFRFNSIRLPLKRSSAVLMVGGDNYSLDYGYPDTFFSLNNFAFQMNRPVILWGASVGPFSKDPKYEEYAAKQLRNIDRIYARESITIKYLKSIGVEENVIRMADPAFLLDPEETQFPDQIKQMINEGAIGVNLSPLFGCYLQAEQAANWPDLAKEIIYAIAETFRSPVILIPHVTFQKLNHKSDDHVFLEKILNLLPEKTRKGVALLGRNYNAAQTKMLISMLKIFIGTRTHSTIAALSSSVPTLVLGYSIKGRGITQDLFEEGQWMIESTSINVENICKNIDMLINNAASIRDHLNTNLPSIRAMVVAAAEDLRKFIPIY